jgi:CPA2 family monovalent cation:H+ antiporter-2
MPHGFFLELLILLASSLAMLALCYPLRIPPILGYILVGVMIGPGGLGWISRPESVVQIAEFGVVFLLFSLGLEFALPKMMAMRRLVLGIGAGQVVITLLMLWGVAWALGVSLATGWVIAGALALSSTAVVTRELTQNQQLQLRFGQIAVAVLLFQDMASVFFLAILPSLGGGQSDPLLPALLWTLGKATVLFAGLLILGPRLLPRLFTLVARTRTEELFVLAVLVVILAAAALTQLMGLSMALGAFIAGMLLGESHFRHQIEAEIRPFRDVLLGIFFVAVGMLIHLGPLAAQLHWIILLTAGFMVLKWIVVVVLARLLGETLENALSAGFALAQGGEFGFALLTLGGAHALISPAQQSLVFSSIMLSMMLAPLLLRLNPRWTRRFARPPPQPDINAWLPDSSEPHVILCGFGRVGQAIARFLQNEQIPYVAIDGDTLRIREALLAGEPVLYGDSRQRALLQKAGLERAQLLVVAFDNFPHARRILEVVREVRADLPVLVRTADDRHWEALQAAGATEIIPETLEGSLMLVSHVLELLGVPPERIQERIRDARRERYKLLHGYLHGKRSRLTDAQGKPLEVVHPVALPETAYAVDKQLGDLQLDQIGVHVQALRRGALTGQDPSAEVRLKTNDTLVLLGTASQIERAEQRLLGGEHHG